MQLKHVPSSLTVNHQNICIKRSAIEVHSWHIWFLLGLTGNDNEEPQVPALFVLLRHCGNLRVFMQL